MNSKKALEIIINNHDGYFMFNYSKEIKAIKKDLDRIEKLKVNVNVAQSLAKRYKQENDELKQALDKACLRLELYDTCPVYAELVEDLDCDNCNDNCKECWKKYFMKEVLKNE